MSNQGGCQVKQISFFVLGSVIVLASAPAPAQDFTAGKTPAQLFSSDCAECHRSPNGLARNRDVRTLASFLREHYTTKSDTAGSLAAYVSGFAGGGAADARNRGGGVAAPANAAIGERSQGDRRSRRDGDATGTGEDVRTTAKPIEDPTGRRRRATNLSGDGEKRRVRNDGDAPRPPGTVAATPPSKLTAPAGVNAPRDATDPISRLRSYLSSGLGLESTAAEAAKMAPPKSRKRRGGKEAAEPTPQDAQEATKSVVDAPSTASPPSPTDVTSTAAPPEGNVPPTSTPAAPTAAPPPRSGQ